MTEDIKSVTDEFPGSEHKEAVLSSPADEENELIQPDDVSETPQVSDQASATLQPVMIHLEHIEQSMAQVKADIEHLSQRIDLIPRQVRQLGTRVDDITESVSQPRIRDLLWSLLQLYDLVEQMGMAQANNATDIQNYQVLGDQIAQVLQVNGVYPINRTLRFDPSIHKAVETTACHAPDEDGEIMRIYRTGFRTDRAIVRYAEVVVKQYQKSENIISENIQVSR